MARNLTPEQKKHNQRLGLILGSIALVFFMGFVGKMVFLGG
ncbi:putative membrane protein [Hydrogenophaga sp. RAC07]|jgi:hypothetical protein|nr:MULTISPECIES: cytochrome oxidase small assembly protein [unclassified Hydrogenophaga]AOF85611.1 putative membrane protein [Hydrogenophaga sp. RAC07]